MRLKKKVVSSMDMTMSTSPLKRRKTRGTFALNSKMDPVTWPKTVIPLEIFTEIMKYLPRSNIQKMRLVNHEFEKKVSAYLFHVVVVPFKPEIYGIAPEPPLGGAVEDRADDMLKGAIMLQDKGMRIFQGFGEHIHKFAMSFEFEESKLANPPVKSDQEAITSFWGIYRWPYKRYNRYAQLEGLEQTADETRTMAKALETIKKAKELGLSIDGGLGWLTGPDINQRVLERREKLVVFGEPNFVPEPRPSRAGNTTTSGASTSISQSNHMYTAFERMLQEAGYRDERLEQSVRMMLETEELTGHSSQASQAFFDNSSFTLENFRRAFRPAPQAQEQSALQTPGVPNSSILFYNTDDDDEEEPEAPQVQNTIAVISKLGKGKIEGYSLKPNDLTNGQKEMLLEIEWAQRAFMQSYSIAVIDNPTTFQTVETLTIARIPHRHLPILRREDFWDGLPNLTSLSLAVIPDWRDVVKLPTSWVQDIRLAPSQSVSGVYQILDGQISHRKNINYVHFEWLCGGEYSPGLFSRNQHIVAAPIVSKSMDMVNRAQAFLVLRFPYVQHLSLKNCWISPHIMSRFTLALKKSACRRITFDSVSLTANLPRNAQPNAMLGHPAGLVAHQVLNHINFQGQLQAIQNVQNPPAPVVISPPNAQPDWLDTPRVGSWAAVIDALTPHSSLADIRFSRELSDEPSAREPTALAKLEFKSCGYIRLPLDFDQTALDSPDPVPTQNTTIAKRINDLEPHMMKPSDPTLGIVINHIKPVEEATLQNAFNMTVGWGIERANLLADSHADGITNAGRGRFSGLIDLTPSPPTVSNH